MDGSVGGGLVRFPPVQVISFDPLLDPSTADSMVDLCERFGRYGMYSQEDVESDIGRGLYQRHDALLNYLRTGGFAGATDEPLASLAGRTNYFREEYAYGQRTLIEGIEPFLHHEGFVEAAREIFGRPVIEPAICFANLMLPGQELALHTDVGEFRGANRKTTPQWLIVAMHHSGLFDQWRMPVATGVAWFHDCAGGEFVFYPDGADGEPRAHSVRHNTALLLDTDSVFHGVDRVDAAGGDLPPLQPGQELVFAGDRKWVVVDGAEEIARYRWDDLRFSVSWKAYCFTDEEEREAWRGHSDDLAIEAIVERFVADMRERDLVGEDVEVGPDLGRLIIDTYIRFPPP